ATGPRSPRLSGTAPSSSPSPAAAGGFLSDAATRTLPIVTSSASVTRLGVTEVPRSGSLNSGHGRERPRHGGSGTCRVRPPRPDQDASAFPEPSLTSARERGRRALRATAQHPSRPGDRPD